MTSSSEVSAPVKEDVAAVLLGGDEPESLIGSKAIDGALGHGIVLPVPSHQGSVAHPIADQSTIVYSIATMMDTIMQWASSPEQSPL